MSNVANRPVPDGYTEKWDSTVWNVGWAFRWSEVYNDWLLVGRLTVKPGQSLSEAFEAWCGGPMWNDYTVLFVEGF